MKITVHACHVAESGERSFDAFAGCLAILACTDSPTLHKPYILLFPGSIFLSWFFPLSGGIHLNLLPICEIPSIFRRN